MNRRILLVAHPRRPEALTVAKGVIDRLTHVGIEVSLQADEAKVLDLKHSNRVHIATKEMVAEETIAEGCDLVVVLGGDGTILRGAEFARSVDIPLLGINLGHVGFLAEAERDDLDATVEHIANRQYAVDERMTLHVDAKFDGEIVASSWALNEVSVEDIEAAGRFFRVATVQNLYNLANRQSEAVLDHCEKQNIGFIPWYPLAAGSLAAPGGPLASVGERLGATPSQVALAWVLKRSRVMLPIPGTSSVKHLDENTAAASVELSDKDFAALDEHGKKEWRAQSARH